MVSILLYVIFFCFTLVYFIIFCVVFLVTLPFDRRRSAVHWLSWLWTKIYFGSVPGWRVEVEGMENVDRAERYVIVVNHRSMLDVLLMYVVPLNFRWVSKKEVYKIPFFGWVLRMHGDIAIERGSGTAIRKMMSEGEGWLEQRVSIAVFPEGTRSSTAKVGRFKDGAFLLAKSAGVGVLPVVMEGTDSALKGWRLNFKNRFRVQILEPVSAEEVQQREAKELAASLQALMSEKYQKLRDENIKNIK